MTTPYRPFLVPPAARWFRWAVAVVWLATGLLVLHPGYRAIGLDHLHRYGLPSWLMTATCIGEIALGAWVVFSRARTGITFLQVGMVASFTAIIAINEPMLLVNPYGAMTKNIPLVILLLVAWRLERGGVAPPDGMDPAFGNGGHLDHGRGASEDPFSASGGTGTGRGERDQIGRAHV